MKSSRDAASPLSYFYYTDYKLIVKLVSRQ